MKKVILLGLLFASFVGYSQIPDESDSDEETTIIEVLQSDESNQNQIYNLVELMPEYPGGIRAFYNYVVKITAFLMSCKKQELTELYMFLLWLKKTEV